MKRNCHIKELATLQYLNGTDFTLPGSTADRYTYAYSYDCFGRLTESARFAANATTSDHSFSERNISFDRNGNILSLTRYGQSAATAKDNFTYTYSGNRIEKLSGTFNGSAITHTEQNSQVSGTADYIYDGNGNMTYDALRHIAMTYDINNLVSTVSRNDTLLSTYTYLADGTKYKVLDNAGNGRYYIGPFCMAIEKTGTGSSAQIKAYLESIDTDSGRILAIREQTGSGANILTNTAYTTAFFTKDHLGSVRAVTDAQGNILERNAYYPFGLQNNQNLAFPSIPTSIATLYPNSISSITARRDLYNGKEIQTTARTDYIDYGFRQYDPITARWFNIDPKAEKYLPLTPYNYCAGSPIIYLDFAGDSIVIDDYGYILHYQESDPDLRVFLNGTFIGSLGDVINADIWFMNLLAHNIGDAIDAFPLTWCSNFQEDEKWDYKYRSPKNQKLKTNKYHIIGIAFYRKDKDKDKGKGDLNETLFTFKGFNGVKGRAEDLNNFHFGVIGTTCGIDPFVLLYGAGFIEKQKRIKRYNEGLEESPLVPEKWRPVYKINIKGLSLNVPMPPFGDNPLDFTWILRGLQFVIK